MATMMLCISGTSQAEPNADQPAIAPPIPPELKSVREIVRGDIFVEGTNYYTRHGITPDKLAMDKGAVATGANISIGDKDSKVQALIKFSETIYNGHKLYGLTMNDQMDSYLGAKAENLWPGMYASLGYSYIRGGLAGIASQYHTATAKPPNVGTPPNNWAPPNLDLNVGKDCANLITAMFRQGARLTKDNVVFLIASYTQSLDSGQGRMTTYGIGHKLTVHENLNIVSTFMANYSYDYWGDYTGHSFNGSDGYALNFEVQWRAAKEVTVCPYIGMTWAGTNPRALNHKTPYAGKTVPQNWQEWKPFAGAFTNFALIFGLKLKWDF